MTRANPDAKLKVEADLKKREAAIRAAWHRVLAEQHQERARWDRARNT